MYELDYDALSRFFAYAVEREKIRQRRALDSPKPWTNDSILQTNRFCNVYREHDKTTVWFCENIRYPLMQSSFCLAATIIFRWFNKIEIGKVLKPMLLSEKWDSGEAKKLILEAYPNGPFVTGAYIINTPIGKNKLDGVLWCIDTALSTVVPEVLELKNKSLESVWLVLKKAPHLGDFMAYEVVTDMRFTPMLNKARDIFFWANPGPGALRGMSRIIGQDVNTFKKGSQSHKKIVIGLMHKILKIANGRLTLENYEGSLWDYKRDGIWEMREVEHTLCEFDKYERIRLGQGKMKQKYNGV